jgi:hypothetical protein
MVRGLGDAAGNNRGRLDMTFDSGGGLDRQAFDRVRTVVTTQQEGLRAESVRLLADEVIRRLEHRAAGRLRQCPILPRLMNFARRSCHAKTRPGRGWC